MLALASNRSIMITMSMTMYQLDRCHSGGSNDAPFNITKTILYNMNQGIIDVLGCSCDSIQCLQDHGNHLTIRLFVRSMAL